MHGTRWLWLCLGVWAGCGGARGGDEPGALTLSSERLDIGEVPLGETGTREVVLTNVGDQPVDVLSVSLAQGDAALWRVDRAGLDSVAGRESGTFSVSFTPRALGAASGRLQIRTSGAGTLSLELAAEGALSTVDADGDGYSPADGDCDDTDPDVYPGAPERCNGIDDDCDGVVPANEADADGDGFRICDGDCDDGDANVYPGAPEICDDKDNDCDGTIPDRDDLDGDGFSVCDGDCDDLDPTAYPGATEVCDGVDNDCNGLVDDVDADGDGHSVCSVSGDCDDDDPDAHPVVVGPGGSATAAGTEADPYDTIEHALANLDAVCREVYLLPGAYTLDATWSAGRVSLIGAGADPADVQLTAASGRRHLVVAGGELTLQHLTLTGGDAPGDGGAVRVDAGGALVLRDVVARDNTSAADGGAIAVDAGALVLEGSCRFEDNTALGGGGAIAARDGSVLDLGPTRYAGNRAARGGAIHLAGGSVQIVGSELRANHAVEEGGAVTVVGGGSYRLERNRMVLNTSDGAGGALLLRDASDPIGVVRNNALQDNTAATVGGGVGVAGATAALSVTNNTIVGNTASGHGAGLHVEPPDASDLWVLGNIIGWSDGLSGAWVAPGSTATVAYNTGFLTTSLVEFAGAVEADVDDNVSRNPRLVGFSHNGDPDDDDLGLLPGSFEIDTGPPDPAYNDLDGTRNDRGVTGGPGASP